MTLPFTTTTADVYRPSTLPVDPWGEDGGDPAHPVPDVLVWSALPCVLDTPAVQGRFDGGTRVQHDWRAHFDPGANVQLGDRLVIDGRSWSVRSLEDRATGTPLAHLRVSVTRVDQEISGTA